MCSPASISSAITYLTGIRALDTEQNLTTFGKYLSEIPLNPRNAVMLLYGILFSCLHPLIIIALFDELRPFTVSEDFLQNDLCWPLCAVCHLLMLLKLEQWSSTFCVLQEEKPPFSNYGGYWVNVWKDHEKSEEYVLSHRWERYTSLIYNSNADVAHLISALIFASHHDNLCSSRLSGKNVYINWKCSA